MSMPLPYGARCTWWDTMDKVGSFPVEPLTITRSDGSTWETPGHPLPCCPICKGMLFQVESLEQWQLNVQAHASTSGDKDYPGFVEWLRGRCFPDYAKARYCYANREQFHPDIGKGPFAGTMTRNMGTARLG